MVESMWYSREAHLMVNSIKRDRHEEATYGQDIAFKDIPPVTYYLYPGPTS
jgi:hypothetical protein